MSVRLLRQMVVGGVVALTVPTLVHAQAVKPSDLVGSWAQQGQKDPYITFRADSTVLHVIQTPDGNGVATGRWHMNGDTLIMSGMQGKVGDTKRAVQTPPRVVKLDKQQLTITRLVDIPGKPKTQMYDRLPDSVQVKPAP